MHMPGTFAPVARLRRPNLAFFFLFFDRFWARPSIILPAALTARQNKHYNLLPTLSGGNGIDDPTKDMRVENLEIFSKTFTEWLKQTTSDLGMSSVPKSQKCQISYEGGNCVNFYTKKNKSSSWEKSVFVSICLIFFVLLYIFFRI